MPETNAQEVQSNMPDLLNLFQRLRDIQPSAAEANVEYALRSFIEGCGRGVLVSQHPVGKGKADLVSHGYHVVLEVKRRGGVNPAATDSDGRTQEEQVREYTDALQRRTETDLCLGADRPWTGFLTDGLVWFGWRTGERTPFLSEHRVETARTLECLVADVVLPADRCGPAPPPEDFGASVLLPFVKRAEDLVDSAERTGGYATKFRVWTDRLRAAGLAPQAHEAKRAFEMFVRHSILVMAARQLRQILGGTEATHESSFGGWLAEHDAGRILLRDMGDALAGYEWRASATDHLRQAYQTMIPKTLRREFGEYYTPDAHAQWAVDELLDDEWMDERISDGSPEHGWTRGVIDPACGSGTLLLHALVRIRERVASAHPGLVPHMARILTGLVTGIDVHPLAQEIASATLATGLPKGSGREPAIYIGDAVAPVTPMDELQCEGDDGALMLPLRSPLGDECALPAAVVFHPDSEALIDRFNAAAIELAADSGSDAASEDRWPELEPAERPGLSRQVRGLATIVSREGNSLWSWVLKSKAGLHRAREQKSTRLLMNPPWIVGNNSDVASRKAAAQELRRHYELDDRIASTSAAGDLASGFTARAVDFYLAPEGRALVILPGSALRNQVWARWRSGDWGAVKVAFQDAIDWTGVGDVPFPHAPNGSCTARLRRAAAPAALPPPRRATGRLDEPEFTGIVSRPSSPSVYHADFRTGCMVRPHVLAYVQRHDVVMKGDGLAHIRTKPSKKGRWRSIHPISTVIESEALIPAVFPSGLTPFAAAADAFLIVPRRRDPEGGCDLLSDSDSSASLVLETDLDQLRRTQPRLAAYWQQADIRFRELRSANAGRTLAENLDWKGTLTNSGRRCRQGAWSPTTRPREADPTVASAPRALPAGWY